MIQRNDEREPQKLSFHEGRYHDGVRFHVELVVMNLNETTVQSILDDRLVDLVKSMSRSEQTVVQF